MNCKIWLLLFMSFITFILAKDSNKMLQEIYTVKKAWESACPLLLSPTMGHYKESMVDLKAVHGAEAEMLRIEDQFLEESDGDSGFEKYLLKHYAVNENAHAIVDNLQNMPIADNFCNPTQFALLVDNMNEPVTCEQVCLHCILGSYPICYAKNRRFPGVARTCLCTYNSEEPITAAAFALKSIPVPRLDDDVADDAVESPYHSRHRGGGKTKRELWLSKLAKSVMFL